MQNDLELLNDMPFDEFLVWFKDATESVWASYNPKKFDEYGGCNWVRGTRWRGYSEEEITIFQKDWNLEFPPDYVHFLKALGAPNHARSCVRWRDGERVQLDVPSIYNWLTDSEHIADAKRRVRDGLLFDIDHSGLWFDSWGERPLSANERRDIMVALIDNAPPLIPITGHRFLLGAPVQTGNPVLSIHQSDIIVYGTDLKRFLLSELHSLLNLDLDDAQRNSTANYDAKLIANIPFWGEFIENYAVRFKYRADDR